MRLTCETLDILTMDISTSWQLKHMPLVNERGLTRLILLWGYFSIDNKTHSLRFALYNLTREYYNSSEMLESSAGCL